MSENLKIKAHFGHRDVEEDNVKRDFEDVNWINLAHESDNCNEHLRSIKTRKFLLRDISFSVVDTTEATGVCQRLPTRMQNIAC